MSDKNWTAPSSLISRRAGLRVAAGGLCTELAEDDEQLGLLLDVSEVGIRIERPHRLMKVRGRERVVQLEFEHPAVDELIWAKGVIRFDKLEPIRDEHDVTRVRRTSGVEIVAAASKHLRLLREFVLDLRSATALGQRQLDMMVAT
ncbi:MAG: PilZ domain-containing protein [Polyangia bacterium]